MIEELDVAPVADSLFAQIRAARDAKQQAETVDLVVPGYGGRLGVTYRALPWAETRRIAARHARNPDAAMRELYIAADTLLAACVDAHAILEDGTHHDLGVGLGADLARRLELDDTDGLTARQAMFLLFARETQLISHYGELMEWQGGEVDPRVDDELVRDFE